MNNKVDGMVFLEAESSSVPTVLTDNRQSIVIEAELQEVEAPNRNQRIYSADSVISALNSPMCQEKLKHKTFYGEAGHPMDDSVKRQTYIDQTRISHIITSFDRRGNHIMGIVESANTSCGADFKGLIRQGSEVAFSMRGLGNVIKKEGSYMRVMSPLMIITYDWIVFPSHPHSYMTKKLTEDTDMIRKYANTTLNESKVIPFNTKELLEYITTHSENVQSIMESFEISPNKDYSNVSISKDQALLIKDGHATVKAFLEDTYIKELDNYFKNF